MRGSLDMNRRSGKRRGEPLDGVIDGQLAEVRKRLEEIEGRAASALHAAHGQCGSSVWREIWARLRGCWPARIFSIVRGWGRACADRSV